MSAKLHIEDPLLKNLIENGGRYVEEPAGNDGQAVARILHIEVEDVPPKLTQKAT